MNIEVELLKEYNSFIKTNSVFKDKLLVLPDTPQSFSNFPTIIFKEANNSDSIDLMTLNRMEYGDDLTYQVEIYTKDVILGNTTYHSRVVINELKDLTAKFFRNVGFTRTSSQRGEYIDINVKRHIMIFNATQQSWNNRII